MDSYHFLLNFSSFRFYFKKERSLIRLRSSSTVGVYCIKTGYWRIILKIYRRRDNYNGIFSLFKKSIYPIHQREGNKWQKVFIQSSCESIRNKSKRRKEIRFCHHEFHTRNLFVVVVTDSYMIFPCMTQTRSGSFSLWDPHLGSVETRKMGGPLRLRVTPNWPVARSLEGKEGPIR